MELKKTEVEIGGKVFHLVFNSYVLACHDYEQGGDDAVLGDSLKGLRTKDGKFKATAYKSLVALAYQCCKAGAELAGVDAPTITEIGFVFDSVEFQAAFTKVVFPNPTPTSDTEGKKKPEEALQ